MPIAGTHLQRLCLEKPGMDPENFPFPTASQRPHLGNSGVEETDSQKRKVVRLVEGRVGGQWQSLQSLKHCNPHVLFPRIPWSPRHYLIPIGQMGKQRHAPWNLGPDSKASKHLYLPLSPDLRVGSGCLETWVGECGEDWHSSTLPKKSLLEGYEQNSFMHSFNR